MAPGTIRKAIGAVKDQTSISLAKVAGNVAPDLEVLIVKATTHDNEPADDKYVREISHLMSYSKSYVSACVFSISRRLSKTHDWIVALKGLMLVHKLLNDGDPNFVQEIMYASRKGGRILNMSDFRDEAHSNSWDHSGFVRTYALYLDQKLEFAVYETKLSATDEELKRFEYGYGGRRDERGYGMERRSRYYGDLDEPHQEKNGMTPVRETEPEKMLDRLNQLLRLLDRFLASRPTGAAKNSRMVIVALHLLVKESFRLYADMSYVLIILLDRFMELEYASCLKAFDAYVSAAKIIDDLSAFYNWCKDIGVLRSSEFPEVQMISDKLLGTLERLLREKGNREKLPEQRKEEIFLSITEEKSPEINEIKALPAPEDYSPKIIPQPLHTAHNQQVTEYLVNMKDETVSADSEGNKFALAFFSAPGAATKINDAWEVFPDDGGPKVTSAWQNPAAESDRAGWELALVETTSNLSKQKADLAGGFDPLLLNGMYDQGTVRQHVNTSQLSAGSASSVALPGTAKSAIPVLALPAPDGTIQPVGQQDPFAASLSVPPPSYVQIAEMERKQQFLTQEQLIWQQYARNGMQGQLGLAKIEGNATYYGAGMPQNMAYGMPQVGGPGHPGAYYYTLLN